MECFRFEITEELEDERIDKCLAMLIDSLSRSFIQKLIKDQHVLVDGVPVRGSYRVRADETVEFTLPEAVQPDVVPEDIPLELPNVEPENNGGEGGFDASVDNWGDETNIVIPA